MGKFKHHSVNVSGGTIESSKTSAEEVIDRGGDDHQRVYDPLTYNLLERIYDELKKMNTHLALITDQEEVNGE